MARIKTKIDAVIVPANATPEEASAKVAQAMGDNATLKASDLEGVILKASSGHAALLDALRRCDVNQKELQQRAYAARWYAQDYMRDVDAGKVNATRDSGGNVVIPAMTDTIRKAYLAKVTDKTKDAEIVRRRSTLRTWWTRLLFDAGIKAIDARGGSANAKRRKVTNVTKADAKPITPDKPTVAPITPDKPTVAPITPATPKVTSPMEAAAFYQREAAILLRFTMANIKPDISGKASPTAAFQKLVSAFVEGVAKIGRDLEKAEAKAKVKVKVKAKA